MKLVYDFGAGCSGSAMPGHVGDQSLLLAGKRGVVSCGCLKSSCLIKADCEGREREVKPAAHPAVQGERIPGGAHWVSPLWMSAGGSRWF